MQCCAAAALQTTAELASPMVFICFLQEYFISFLDVSKLDMYFRCVFLVCGLNDEVEKPWKLAQEVFDALDSNPYFPHLSLMYSDVEQAKR